MVMNLGVAFFEQLLREVVIEGGCSRDRLGALVRDITKRQVDEGVLDFVFNKLASIEGLNLDPENKIAVSYDLLRLYLCENRLIALTNTALRVLSIIAATRTAGITQANLAKALKMDSRSVFHHMKYLLKHELVVKIPVSANKSFTYLILFRKHFDEGLPHHTFTEAEKMALPEIRQGIIRIMTEHPTIFTRTLFAELKLDKSMSKSFHRALLWLSMNRVIHFCHTTEMGGHHEGRLIQLTMNGKEATDVVEKKKEETPSLPSLRPPYKSRTPAEIKEFEQELMRIVEEAGPGGITVQEIATKTQSTRKYAYRVQDRLSVDVKDMGSGEEASLVRTSEFYGKEHRLRIFTRENWLKRFDDTCLQPVTPKYETKRASSSLTLATRQNAILKLLEDTPILELGKPLTRQIQALLGSQHELDVKTLKRTTTLMEQNGLLKRLDIRTGKPALNRSIIYTMAEDDPRLEEYITNVSKPEDKPLPPPPAKNRAFAISRWIHRNDPLGCIHGLMARARTLHQHLSQFDQFETRATIYQDMPFILCRKLVGILAIPKGEDGEEEALPEDNTPLKDLSPPWYFIIESRIQRHRYILRVLLGILDAIGAIEPEYDEIHGLSESVVNAWKLGYDALHYAGVPGATTRARYVTTPLLPPRFKVKKEFLVDTTGTKLNSEGLWHFLHSLRKQPFAFDLDHLTPLHVALTLAHHPPCWMPRADSSHVLKTAIKGLILELHGKPNSKGIRYIPNAAWMRDVPEERLLEVYERCGVDEGEGRECFEKYRRKQYVMPTAKPSKRRPSRTTDLELEGEGEGEEEADEDTMPIKWTDEDNERLLLAYHLLYFNQQFNQSARRSINWRLLDTIHHPHHQPTRSRRERMRRTTVASKQLYNLLKTFKWRTTYYGIAERVAAIGGCTLDNFKDMFDYYYHSSQSVSEQGLRELRRVQYVPLPPFDTLTRECRWRLPEEAQVRICDAPFASEPEGDIARGVKRLRLSLLKKDTLVDVDEGTLKWAQRNNLLSPSNQATLAINWYLEKRITVDLEQDYAQMKDDAFDKLTDMAMKGQVRVTPGLHIVSNQVLMDPSAYTCDDSFLWFNEQTSALDHDLFSACCERILERFERDYALELDNLSHYCPLLTRQEIASVLEYLLTIGKLGKEDTIYYYTAN